MIGTPSIPKPSPPPPDQQNHNAEEWSTSQQSWRQRLEIYALPIEAAIETEAIIKHPRLSANFSCTKPHSSQPCIFSATSLLASACIKKPMAWPKSSHWKHDQCHRTTPFQWTRRTLEAIAQPQWNQFPALHHILFNLKRPRKQNLQPSRCYLIKHP